MSYEFGRFSTQSFERFCQTLAMKQLGPGTQIYGAGADGAREATFEGKFSPDLSGQRYDGYVVVQAKFRKETKSSSSDLTWLKQQADREFKKFSNPRRQLKAPDYYILVSNITLTPGAADASGKASGTLDQLISHMEPWRTELGCKQLFIWHSDVLSAFLDIHADLRTTFSSWVLPGDVLSAALENFKKPEFATVIKRVVRDELKDQRGIKTQDSAISDSSQIFIEDVFVDLPMSPWVETIEISPEDYADFPTDYVEDLPTYYVDFTDTDITSASQDLNIVNQIMTVLSDKLSTIPKSVEKKDGRGYQRIVVLGGPGQGKSTIGQFISQLLRARLVLADGNVLPEVRVFAEETLNRARAERVDLSGPLRFPIHISLPRYADTISRTTDDTPSLLRYVAGRFSRISDETVEPKLLRDWIAHYPSVIILDGLDEVPRTGNRADVIRAIERLVSEIHEVGADTLVLVTSRPQGYLDDLSPKFWTHWDLADLDAENAVRFAERLSTVLISDRTRREEVLAVVREAALDQSTSPLMISPLQISLLLSLIMTRSDIPKDRWTLFERHYETLRDREIAKGGANGTLIKIYRSEIDRIHFDAGFILQVRAEKQGNANAQFTLPEFRSLIQRHVAESVVDKVEADEVATKIMDVATKRLVFLGDRNEDRIAFDVRSLQEFMAAARIMTSPEPLIPERLREIALKSHWAHVFRIACSKVYAQASLQDFRQSILTILGELDNGDWGSDYRAIRAGARLALNLLFDSSAGARQTDKVKLMARAVKILEVDGTEDIRDLVSVADKITIEPLNRTIIENLAHRAGPLWANSLRFLISLTRQVGHPLMEWGEATLSQLGNLTDDDKLLVLDLSIAPNASHAAKIVFQDIVWTAGPHQSRVALSRVADQDLQPFGNIYDQRIWLEEQLKVVGSTGKQISGLMIHFRPLKSFNGVVPVIPDYVSDKSGWHLLVESAKFSMNPSIDALADTVACASRTNLSNIVIGDLPWPISACLTAQIRGAVNFEDLLIQIRRGDHGQAADWVAAEERWKSAGLKPVDTLLSKFKPFNLLKLITTGPPVRKFAKSETNGILTKAFMRESSGWSIDERMRLLPLLCFFSDSNKDAKRIANWISDDLLKRKWGSLTEARVAGLIRDAITTSLGEAVEKLIKKIPGDVMPWKVSGEPWSALIKLLQNSQQRDWAALAIYTTLPSANQIDVVLADLDSRVLLTPIGASAKLARAYTVLRALGLKITSETIDEDMYALLALDGEQPFSIVLRKMYQGQRVDPILESFVCKAAEAALDRNYRDRAALLQIIAEVLASRQSDLDDPARLGVLALPVDVERDALIE